MGVIKARECRLHGCGLRVAGPAPNKKRLALCLRRPHRPHLTGRRKSPKSNWGAFSAPGLKAGEEGWKGGILGPLPAARILTIGQAIIPPVAWHTCQSTDQPNASGRFLSAHVLIWPCLGSLIPDRIKSRRLKQQRRFMKSPAEIAIARTAIREIALRPPATAGLTLRPRRA